MAPWIGFSVCPPRRLCSTDCVIRSTTGVIRSTALGAPTFTARALLRNHPSRRGARRLFCRRDHERDPAVPAGGPVLIAEFPVAFEIEVPLRLGGQGDDEPELRPGAHHLRLEAAHAIAGSAVAADLRVDIANG